MKIIISSIAAIAMVILFSNNAVAQTESTDIGAKILTAITISKTADMLFCIMTSPTTAAEVDIAVDGTATITSGSIFLLAQGPTSSAAAYDITGDPGATYAITLPANGVITITEGATPIPLTDFICSYGGLTSTFDERGDDNFTVGATLQLANAQPAGTYTGTFTVSVSYN